ncbi:MAG: Na/Pi cotransporter family protein [Azonexus sp.]|nr:Na/Pi cotransporter family protein [Azonexus sp.]
MFTVEMFGLLLGGLALFLFGLELLTGAFKAIAGARLQTWLGVLTASRWRGLLAGAGITAALNSSTITTVLLVGFVSAGLMTLAQAIPMILGANVGSTVTAQLVAFNLSAAVFYFLGGGFLLRAFAKREMAQQIGNVLMGLGLLFFGIELMGQATGPLRDYQPFIAAMQDMRNPLLGILIGAVFTAIVQSSAATLAVVIALAGQGLVPLEAGIAIVLGANAGTCGTTLLAAIGKPPEALQVALVHLMFNLFGVLVFILIIPWFAELVRWISPVAPELQGVARLAAETPRQIANAHTLFNVSSALLLIGFTGRLEHWAQRLAPGKPAAWKASGEPRFLDRAMLAMPPLAVARIQLELSVLGEQVAELTQQSAAVAISGEEQDIAKLLEQDRQADQLGAEILSYIGSLTEAHPAAPEGREIVALTLLAASLDATREVAATSLLGIARRRLAEGVDLRALHAADAVAARFYAAAGGSLRQAVALIAAPDGAAASRIVAAKADLEAEAAAARDSVMAGLPLSRASEVANFRLSNEMIEQFNEIARLSRAIAKATRELRAVGGGAAPPPVQAPTYQDGTSAAGGGGGGGGSQSPLAP